MVGFGNDRRSVADTVKSPQGSRHVNNDTRSQSEVVTTDAKHKPITADPSVAGRCDLSNVNGQSTLASRSETLVTRPYLVPSFAGQ